ncbi:MAG: RNA methyltransferase [Hyphomicrobiales bacterium]
MTEARLTITAMGRRAEGLASHDGQAVHVPLSLPGEDLRVALDGTRGSIREILLASPERIAPFCGYYGRCGGCQLQHWQEEPYRAWKRGLVDSALAARGIAAKVSVLIDAHGAGRRRVSIHARRRDGVATAGFMAARSHDLLDLDRCPVLVPALARAFDVARILAARLGDSDVAVTATGSGLDVSVRAERKVVSAETPKLAGLARELDLARLSVNGEVVVMPRVPLVPMGKAMVPIPPVSFLQATAEGEEQLGRLVVEALGKARNVADLFSGCGPFTFRAAERARVRAFDSDRPAIAALVAAQRATTGLKPITAEARDLFRAPLVASELREFDAVVFDPPRAGAEAQAQQLAKSGVKTVVAVSCDPVTLARDAAILVGGGYRLDRVTAVDQFKWTAHVETVARFSR